MNTAELTALHTETITDMKRARTIANINRRALSLFSDGYTAEPFACGIFFVTSPKGDQYTVTCDSVLGHNCTCPAFAEYDTCKHLLAIAKDIEDGENADRSYLMAEEVNNFFNGRYDF